MYNPVTITGDFKSPFHPAISIQARRLACDWCLTRQEFLMRTLLIAGWTYFVGNKPSAPWLIQSWCHLSKALHFSPPTLYIDGFLLTFCFLPLFLKKLFHHHEICMNIFTSAGHFCDPSLKVSRRWMICAREMFYSCLKMTQMEPKIIIQPLSVFKKEVIARI